MKNYYLGIVGAVAIALGLAPVAQATKADAVSLDFSLVPVNSNDRSIDSSLETPGAGDNGPLPIPRQAGTAPLGSESTAEEVVKLPPPPKPHLTEITTAEVEPAPELTPTSDEPVQTEMAMAETAQTLPQTEVQPQPEERSPQTTVVVAPVTDGELLNFALAKPAPSKSADTAQPLPAAALAPAPSAPPQVSSDLDALFHGGSNSLIARAVGSAEGTRTPDGDKTWAYRGHVDPGNGVWNMGTFSYQHGARSPEEADLRQLRRLKRQAQQLRESAASKGLQLTLEEELNGIDLANQSPRAALSRGGYIDRLEQAQMMGLQGADAILWARTRSFLDPDTSQWNAPGLGNNVYSITNDQERRRQAIARAIAARPPQQVAVSPVPRPLGAATPPDPSPLRSLAEINADFILSLDLPSM